MTLAGRPDLQNDPNLPETTATLRRAERRHRCGTVQPVAGLTRRGIKTIPWEPWRAPSPFERGPRGWRAALASQHSRVRK